MRTTTRGEDRDCDGMAGGLAIKSKFLETYYDVSLEYQRREHYKRVGSLLELNFFLFICFCFVDQRISALIVEGVVSGE